jgi:putative transposase
VGEYNPHQYLIHDRDSIFAKRLDDLTTVLGLRVLKSPPRSPKANAICERVVGTIRGKCLDWIIPITEKHLCTVLKRWVNHYNSGRPRSSLGPGLPGPPNTAVATTKPSNFRHRLAEGAAVRSISVLGGLHHEYSLTSAVA